MWDKLINKFKSYPAQEAAVKLIFERGFQISEEGKVCSGTIKIPHTQIAKEAEVDPRAVDAAALRILEDEELFLFFKNLKSVAFLRDAAPLLGLGVIVITPKFGEDIGIIAEVSRIIADEGYSIRQAISDDPYMIKNPKLTIITNKKLSGAAMEKIVAAKGIDSVSIK
ncbi:MAG: amino acid-binding protein [Methanosarcinaceae archaeon]|nr:amino acid-binding protein [Methanosarcinaceae archaeon]